MEPSPLRTYILNTSFHGFRFLAETHTHWSEKLFWVICLVLSWMGTGLLLRANWDDYQHNAIQFVAETSYLEWDTAFPSISICEIDNQDRIAEVTDMIYGDPHDYNLDEIIKELVYFRGLSFYTLQICGSTGNRIPECNMKNFTIFSELIRSDCPKIFQKCKWNDVEFDCCTYFHQVDTEMGACFSINSRQTKKTNVPRLEMISNREKGLGRIYMEVLVYSNVYIMGEQEVPSLSSLQTDVLQITPHIHYRRYIALNEIENEPEVRDFDIRQRNCRFMEESDLDVYPYYSYSACSVQCRKDAQYRMCNCSHHLMPNTEPSKQCNIEGLECLNKNYNDLAVLKAHWANRSGLVCYCIPSCTEVELTIIKDDKIGTSYDYSIVEIVLDRLPSERFKRNVIKGKLDLVVSMGGTAALFIGASILSFVEILYYFVVRPLSNKYMDKSNEKNIRIKRPIK